MKPKVRPHTWAIWTFIARRTCTHCGLVWLRNARSDAAAHAPCPWWL